MVSRLITAGLDLVSGSGGGLLLDGSRAINDGHSTNGGHGLGVDPLRRAAAQDWLQTMRWVHRFGARSSCCMSAEPRLTWEQRMLHLSKLRSLQDEDPGIRYFYLESQHGIDSPADAETKHRVHMVSRIFLDNVPCFQESGIGVAAKTSLLGLAVGINEIRVNIDSKNEAETLATLQALTSLKTAGIEFHSRIEEGATSPGIH